MEYVSNIEKLTVKNNNYRKVEYTSSNEYGIQITLMSLNPGEEIGTEIHPHTDQFLRFEQGKGEVIFGKTRQRVYTVKDGSAVVIPAGTWHNVINTGSEDLKLYSIYTPPEHPVGLIQRRKPKKD